MAGTDGLGPLDSRIVLVRSVTNFIQALFSLSLSGALNATPVGDQHVEKGEWSDHARSPTITV